MSTRNLGFRTFVTPQFGVILFWLIAIPLVIAALIAFWNKAIWMGLYFLLWAVLVRVGLETMTILFNIHDVLVEIRDKDKKEREQAEREEKLARARELAARATPSAPGETRLEG